VVMDTFGRLLLQKRDDIPPILYPGQIGVFGGHREGDESFLECAVRELREELSYDISPERFEYLGYREGHDEAIRGGVVRAEYFLVTRSARRSTNRHRRHASNPRNLPTGFCARATYAISPIWAGVVCEAPEVGSIADPSRGSEVRPFASLCNMKTATLLF
jgi:ADP-ribose pyrophosphatase YjhB (NUDIX family)